MSPPLTNSEKHANSKSNEGNGPTAKQACTACRRRKSKCNRALPSCSQCSKYRQHCLYEKGWKTPLTRRNLTEVENELARVKAMLQQTRAHSETTGIMSPTPYSIPNPQVSSGEPQQFDANDSDILMSSSDEISRGSQQPPPGMTAPSVILSPVLSHGEAHANSDLNMSSNLNLASSVRHVVRKLENTHHIYSKSSLTQLELEPTQCLFEWDERTSDVGDDGSADGMGILPNESDMGGYLGVTSGAALLRLTGAPPADAFLRRIPTSRLPSLQDSLSISAQLVSYVDAYFQTYHICYPLIHEPTFRAQLMEVIPRPSHQAWQVLLYVIAALGAFSSATQSTDSDIILFKEAEKRFSVDMLRTGNILLVQATTLMANYLQKRNRPNSGYNYLGLARRMAMGIGLHKELDHSSASLLQQEEKRRTWWCLFVFDSGMTITLSRPMDLPNGGIEVNLPLNVHDSNLTAATSHVADSKQTTTYTHLRAQSTFHLATSSIYSKIISSPFPSAGELVDLDDNYIGQWLAAIPDFFSETAIQDSRFLLGRSILSWRYRNFHILMYRPFLIKRVILDSGGPSTVKNATDNESLEYSMVDMAVQRCSSAAAETIHQIASFWSYPERRNMLACWYAMYFLFQAVFIPVICLRNDPQADAAPGWRDQIQMSISTLSDMVPLSAAAEKCLSIISTLCSELLLPDDTLQFQVPTDESPQTQLDNLSWLWAPIGAEHFAGMDASL